MVSGGISNYSYRLTAYPVTSSRLSSASTFLYAKNTQNYREYRVAHATVYIWMKQLPAIQRRRKGALTSLWLGAPTHRTATTRMAMVVDWCLRVRECVCLRVCAWACAYVRDVFAIRNKYFTHADIDNNYNHFPICHTHRTHWWFPSTGTRLVHLIRHSQVMICCRSTNSPWVSRTHDYSFARSSIRVCCVCARSHVCTCYIAAFLRTRWQLKALGAGCADRFPAGLSFWCALVCTPWL